MRFIYYRLIFYFFTWIYKNFAIFDFKPGLERKLFRKEDYMIQIVALKKYIRGQSIVTLFLLFLIILFEHYFTGLKMFTASVFILLSIITTGAMLEQHKWIFYLEFISPGFIWIFTVIIFPDINLSLVLMMTGVLFYYKTLIERYYKYLYY
jgi:alkylglycerol monooxygenase